MSAPCPYRNLPGTADGCVLCGAPRQQHVSYSSANEDPTPGEEAAHAVEINATADAVCHALLRLHSPESLKAALGTDLPEGVADVLLALTAWMDATGQVDMSKRTITFVAKGEKYSLLTEGDLERLRGETFAIVVDNLRTPTVGAIYRQTEEFKAGIEFAAQLVETVGAYYIVKYREAVAAMTPAETGEPVEPLPPTDPSPSMG